MNVQSSNRLFKAPYLRRGVKWAQAIAARLGIGVVRANSLHKLSKEAHAFRAGQIEGKNAIRDMDFLLAMPRAYAPLLLEHLTNSTAEFRQDLFVLCQTNFKRGGYFVEFGATNGYSGSNTHLLEASFGWTGVLAEPGQFWHEDLKRNRSAHVERKCVWSTSGQVLLFNEATLAGLSTIDAYSSSDGLGAARRLGRKYQVETISLNDLLKKYAAPSTIDYLSVDTEGSELEILSAVDFQAYQFRCITVEHNNNSNRGKIHHLLQQNGYVRIHESISYVDDWYINGDSSLA